MQRRNILTLGATLAVVAAPSAAFAAGGQKLTVRVEGRTRTLLPATVVQPPTGSITKDGAPAGACPAHSGAGALDVATRHRWSGTFDPKYGTYEIKTILGDYESTKSSFWEIFVDNVPASTGVCGIKLHPGEQLLFAAVPVSGYTYPTTISAPRKAIVGHAFKIKVVWFNASGVRKPLAGARVTGKGITSVVTNGHGVATVTAAQAGTLALSATRSGYVRAATVRVRVSG